MDGVKEQPKGCSGPHDSFMDENKNNLCGCFRCGEIRFSVDGKNADGYLDRIVELKTENKRLHEALWSMKNDMVNIHNLLLDFYSEENVYPFNPEYAFNHSKQALQKLKDSEALKEKV